MWARSVLRSTAGLMAGGLEFRRAAQRLCEGRPFPIVQNGTERAPHSDKLILLYAGATDCGISRLVRRTSTTHDLGPPPPPEAGALRAPGCAQSATTPAVRVGKLFLYNKYALLEDALTHATATISYLFISPSISYTSS